MKKEMMIFALCAIMLAGVASANAVPVINDVQGPGLLLKGESGTWTVSAYDPDAEHLKYSVQWGDDYSIPASASAGPFRHAYSSPGNYTATFTVVDDKGASAQGQSLVHVYEIQAPPCPGFTRLAAGDAVTDGVYSMELEGVHMPNSFEPGEGASFRLENQRGDSWQRTIGTGDAFRITMPNGDQITVELCGISYDPYGSSYSSQFSNAYMRLLVNGKAAAYGYQPNVEDTCQNDPQFTLIYVGGVVQSQSLQARLSDISVAIGPRNTHPAILDILSASDNFTVPAMQVTIEPFYLQPVTLPWGKRIFITVCRANPGISLNSKWAEIKVQDEYGMVVPYPNQPPAITGVSGPTSLAPGEMGTWNISAHDPDGTFLSYSVQWGDEGSYKSSALSSAQTGSAASLQHTYAQPGNYTIAFTVTDSKGASTQATLTANVISAQAPAVDYSPPEPPSQLCDDGTKDGECSADKPKLCLNGYLFDDATKCGCPAGKTLVGTQCATVAVAASPGGAMHQPAESGRAMQAATPLPEQPSQLDRIIALLEEIKQMLQQILKKI